MKKLSIIYCVLFSSLFSICNAQNLCDPTSSEYISNGFEFLTPSVGCGPFAVKLEDKSGGTDIKYIYYYGGEDKSELDNLNPTIDVENTYFTPPNTKNYTILQYGKDGSGNDFYSCKNVVVRVSNEPKFSYTLCRSSIAIAIPEDPVNDFDYYEVEIDGTSLTVQADELPFAKSMDVSYSIELKMEGFHNNSTLSCGATNSETILAPTLANYPNGIDLPYDPNFDSLIMNSETELSLYFSGGLAGVGYKLFRREKENDFNPSEPLLKDVYPGEINLLIPDPTKVYCFYATRTSECGSTDFSSEICSIPVNEPTTTSEGSISFEWQEYPKGVSGFLQSFSKNIYIEKYLDGNIEKVSLSQDALDFKDQVGCFEELFYRVVTETEGRLSDYNYHGLTYSSKIIIAKDSIIPSALSTQSISVTTDTQPIYTFEDDTDWISDPEKYFLFDETGTIVDSSTLADSFLVPVVASEEPKCFQIGYRDECQRLSEKSNLICTAHLSLEEDQSLTWEPIDTFDPDEDVELILQYRDEATGNFEDLSTITIDQEDYRPSLVDFDDEALFRLKIVGLSSGLTSFSNEQAIPLKFKLFIPEAFSPNGVNPDFKIFGSLEKIKEFSISIYNRNGRLIFESREPKFEWEPKSGGIPSVYHYAIILTTNKDEVIKKVGKITVL